MQIANDTTIRLMIVDESIEAAESVVSAMRNSGIAVRPLGPQNTDEMTHMLASQPIDLVLAADITSIPLLLVKQLVDASGRDLPIVILADSADDIDRLTALLHGIRAIALRRHTDHLLSVVKTEWTDLQVRRKLRRTEAQLRETERRCDALIASSRDPIAYIHEGMHIRANEAYLETFGFTDFDEVEGLSLLDLLAPQYVEGFKQLLKSLAKGEQPPPHYSLEARTFDGTTFPVTLEFATASYEGESCVQVVLRRRNEMDPELAREVEDLRQRDMVTGLLNRPTFLHALENAVAQAGRDGGQYALLLIEPDHHERLLEQIGLDATDTLIAALGQHLSSQLGSDIPIARFSEHRFAVLLAGDHANTGQTAEKLRAAFAAQVFAIGQHSTMATVSIGGVQIGERIASVGPVLAQATESLQTAMETGGNAISIFDPGAVDRAEQERVQRWVERLREALSGEGFILHYQPLLSLHGEPGELYETYLRFQDNDEVLASGAFLGIAEEHGLLPAIDQWVARRAIEVLAERQRAGHDTRLLIKISPQSFATPQLSSLIASELARQGVPGERLWLGTPESKVFTHLSDAQRFLAEVVKLGCRMGLEQFGSGLDSFQLLSHFQPAFLKLDRDFTSELSKANEHQDKIREITARAQPEGIHTIAEFVQDAATMSLLFSAGVDYVAGLFVGRAGATMNFDFS